MAAVSRVGLDVASVADVRVSLSRYGNRYLERVYTAGEIASCGGPSVWPGRLAECFAAKEAVVKVLATQGEPLDLRDVEIGYDRRGAYDVRLGAGAATIARRDGLVSLSVSSSRDGDVAVAFAVGTFSCEAGVTAS